MNIFRPDKFKNLITKILFFIITMSIPIINFLELKYYLFNSINKNLLYTLVFFIIIIISIISIFINGIKDEGYIFDIEYLNDVSFSLNKYKKSIIVPFNDFIITNLKVYRDEVNLFTKENRIRIKMKEKNINNLKTILRKLGNFKYELYLTENINEMNKKSENVV